MRFGRTPLLALVLLANPAAPWAQAPGITQPLQFKAKELDARRSEGLLKLKGDVRVDHGQTVITANQMTFYYADDQSTIEKIVAVGKVRLTEPGRRGSAEHAVYLPPSQKIALTGSPVIWDGDNQLAGSEIVIFRNPDRMSVKGARAVVQPEAISGALAQQNAATSAATSATAQPKAP